MTVCVSLFGSSNCYAWPCQCFGSIMHAPYLAVHGHEKQTNGCNVQHLKEDKGEDTKHHDGPDMLEVTALPSKRDTQYTSI